MPSESVAKTAKPQWTQQWSFSCFGNPTPNPQHHHHQQHHCLPGISSSPYGTSCYLEALAHWKHAVCVTTVKCYKLLCLTDTAII